MNIKFIDYGASYNRHKAEYDQAWERVNTDGKLILQEDVEEFEKKLASYIGVKYAVGVNSGTDALFLSLKAMGVGPGDEVITVSNTFKATITAIMHTGATPVIVDIGIDYLMDPAKVVAAITPKTRVIIPVHLSGDVCAMEKIMDIAQRYNLDVVEDTAQALGGEYAGKKAGSFGTTGCFSFYPAKILGCFGDAGAVTTNDPLLANELKELRNHYKLQPGGLGYNSRLDNLQAAVLNVKLKYLPEILAHRKVVAEYYNENLKGTGDIVLPPNRQGKVWQDYIIRVRRRDELAEFLKAEGIGTMTPPVLPHKELGLEFELPKTESYNLEYLRLPCNPEVTPEQAEYVVAKIKEFYPR